MDWTSQLFRMTEDANNAMVIHVGKNHSKGRDEDQPLFLLVPCPWKGSTKPSVYAAFLNDQSGQEKVTFFPFSF